MKKILIAGIAALSLIPSTVMAQPHQAQQQQRPDTRDHRYDQRDDRQVRQAPAPKRDAHNPRQEARWDYSREVREYNRAKPWKAAPFKYQRFKAGATIRPAFYARPYVIDNFERFRFSTPRINERWVRHYDDALLVNVRSGRVVKVMQNAFRHR